LLRGLDRLLRVGKIVALCCNIIADRFWIIARNGADRQHYCPSATFGRDHAILLRIRGKKFTPSPVYGAKIPHTIYGPKIPCTIYEENFRTFSAFAHSPDQNAQS